MISFYFFFLVVQDFLRFTLDFEHKFNYFAYYFALVLTTTTVFWILIYWPMSSSVKELIYLVIGLGRIQTINVFFVCFLLFCVGFSLFWSRHFWLNTNILRLWLLWKLCWLLYAERDLKLVVGQLVQTHNFCHSPWINSWTTWKGRSQSGSFNLKLVYHCDQYVVFWKCLPKNHRAKLYMSRYVNVNCKGVL